MLLLIALLAECLKSQGDSEMEPLAIVRSAVGKLDSRVRSVSYDVLTHTRDGADKLIGVLVAHVTRETRPRGRMRVDYTPDIGPTSGGTFIEDAGATSYDGEFGMRLLRTTRELADVEGEVAVSPRLDLNRLWLSRGRPKSLDSFAHSTGWEATLWGADPSGDHTLSDLLSKRSAEWSAEASDDNVYRLIWKAPSGGDIWEHEWKLRITNIEEGHIQLLSAFFRVNGRTIRSIEADAHAAALSGAWYPQAVRVRVSDREEKLHTEWQCEWSRVVENCEVDRATLRLDLTPGIIILDETTGQSLLPMSSSNDMDVTVSKQVEDIRNALRNRDVGGGTASVFLSALGLGVLVFGLGARSLLRKRSRSSTGIGLVLLLTLAGWGSSVCHAQVVQHVYPEVRAHNCAVQSLMVVSTLYSIDLSATQAASLLDCDPAWTAPVSLVQIARAARELGLEATAFQGFRLSTMSAESDSLTCWVVHRTSGQGHFSIVIPGDSEVAIIADLLTGVKSVRAGDSAWVAFEESLTGSALRVTKTRDAWDLGRSDASTHSLEVDDHTEYVIPVTNSSAVDIDLESIAGSCSCIRRVRLGEGVLRIRAGGSALLTVELAEDFRETFGQEQHVILQEKNGAVRRLRMYRRVADQALEQQVLVSPSEIEFQIASPDAPSTESAADSVEGKRLDVFVRSGWAPTVEQDAPFLEVTLAGAEPCLLRKEQAVKFTYDVRVSGLPSDPGPHRSMVRLKLRRLGTSSRDLVVPVFLYVPRLATPAPTPGTSPAGR